MHRKPVPPIPKPLLRQICADAVKNHPIKVIPRGAPGEAEPKSVWGRQRKISTETRVKMMLRNASCR
jgi:hypothetical protein